MDMKALGNLKSAEEYIIFVIIYGEMVDLSGQSIPLVQETVRSGVLAQNLLPYTFGRSSSIH